MIAWQKARVLTKKIYETTNQGDFAKDYGLRDQIRRASVSMMSNIAEGFERFNKKEFHYFLNVGKSSCGEVRSQLYIAYDVGYINSEKFTELKNNCIEVSKILGKLRSTVESRMNEKKLSTPHLGLSTKKV
ncbi:MAG: four helix bundle protein [Pyrinomonadaceae bacterium]